MGDSINSLESYMTWVKEQRGILEELNKVIAPYSSVRYDIFFRGVSDSDYADIPSVYRDGLYCKEDVIFNEALSRSYGDFVADKTTFDMLVRMQHYGVPTRLLDITSDPFVALYFAARKPSRKNATPTGKVIAYFVSQKKTFYSDSPEVCLYANLAKLEDVSIIDEHDKKNCERLLRNASKDTPENLYADKYNLLNIYCVKPRMNNPRIIRQKGSFLLFGQIVSKAFPPKIQSAGKIKQLTDIWSYVWRTCGIANAWELRDNDYKSEVDETIKNCDPILNDCWNGFKELIKKHIDTDKFNQVYERFSSDLKCKIKNHLADDFTQITVRSLLHETRSNLASDNSDKLVDNISYYTAVYDVFCKGGSIGKNEAIVDNKTTIAGELENFGICRESIFPELDVLGESLRKKYERK